ncbi:MAG: AcrB/AcrD/AcrF family protein [Planctomycetota bacterium]|nr:MAG: AcrB/AcrD/AcrF family protein [Planctomycetota bacterium]
MILTDVSIKNRTTVFVLVIALAIGGVFSYIFIPREAFPEIKIPFINVVTTYREAPPTDIESLITNQIEKELKDLADIEELTSISAQGMSVVNIQFDPSVDVDEAYRKVKDRVERTKLPQDADDPVVSELNLTELPIIIITVSGDAPHEILKGAAEEISDIIEAEIPGILDVKMFGDREPEIRVEVDPYKTAIHNVTIPEVIARLIGENTNVSAGVVRTPETHFGLRIAGEFTSPEEIKTLVIAERGGKPIYLRDLARIVPGYKDVTSYSRHNGKPAISLLVQKRTGANVIFVADAVKYVVDEAKKDPRLMAAGIEINTTNDQSHYIKILVADLENNILTGFILVLVVLFIFMGYRGAIFVAIAMPFSMMLTFLVLYSTGYTMNMIVLFSLILAIGMLVDNAIVIVENIYRHMQDGEQSFTAAVKGTAEVAWPVITSTLTTVCAFLPLMFWPGIMGKFMGFLPRTVITVLLSSLFVALVINPTFCAVFMRVKRIPDSGGEGRKARMRWRNSFFVRGYEGFVRLSLRHRAATMFVAVVCLALTIFLYLSFGQGLEFFPKDDPQMAAVSVKGPEGMSLEESNRIAGEIEADLESYMVDGKLENYVCNVGSRSAGAMSLFAGASNPSESSIQLEFLDYADRIGWKSADVITEMRDKFDRYPEAKVKVDRQQHGPPSGAPVTVEIAARKKPSLGFIRDEEEEYRRLGEVARKARRIVENVPGAVDVDDDYVTGVPEFHIRVDRTRAVLDKLNTRIVGEAVKATYFGKKASTFRTGEDEYDITVIVQEEDRRKLATLKNLYIPNMAGARIPIPNTSRIVYAGGPGAIRHKDHKRTITVKSDILPGENAHAVRGRAVKALEDFVQKHKTDYQVTFTGEQKEQDKARAFLGKAFVIALFLIMMVLITQFNSIAQPLIIISSVILSLCGVFLGLLVFGKPFGVIMTGVGVISLAGVVVNNAIVLIDCINQNRKKGMNLHEAVVEGGKIRLRPVLLTAITTILGLLPMAAGFSMDFRNMHFNTRPETAQFWGSMASAVVMGLAAATFLTLIVVPALYTLLTREKLVCPAPGVSTLPGEPEYRGVEIPGYDLTENGSEEQTEETGDAPAPDESESSPHVQIDDGETGAESDESSPPASEETEDSMTDPEEGNDNSDDGKLDF